MTDHNEWQPIETAPKDGTPIIVLMGKNLGLWTLVECVTTAWFNPDDRCWDSEKYTLDYDEIPTHWLAIPTPPEDTERAS